MRTVLAVILLTLLGAWSAHAMWGRGAALQFGHAPPPPPPPPPSGCQTGSMCPPGNWVIAAREEFNGAGLSPNGPLTETTGECCGQQFYTDNSGDGTGITPIFNGSTVTLRSFTGNHGCSSLGVAACGGNGYTWKGTTGAGYYEARLKDDGSNAYVVWWFVVDNNGCADPNLTGGFEADIMEDFGGGSGQDNTHYGGYSTCHVADRGPTFSSSDGFHLWGVEWPDASGGITYWRDGVAVHSLAGPIDTTGLVGTGLNGGINIAGAPGTPNGGSTMQVDWVRYYHH